MSGVVFKVQVAPDPDINKLMVILTNPDGNRNQIYEN